jgi:DNA (cytosine-5)-methyltransferase 1
VADGSIDCRYHREPGDGMPVPPRGADKYFSGRPISEELVAPWLQGQSLTAAHSGWQTRTYERPQPYTLAYRENIRPRAFKTGFLQILDLVEEHGESAEEILTYLVAREMEKRDAQDIPIAVSSIDTVSVICNYLNEHFMARYETPGAARLPVLALYAVYDLIMGEVQRFDGKQLLPLQEHSAADTSSGAIGDIEVCDGESKFEGVEVKHLQQITAEIIRQASLKFREHRVKRYYILTTADPYVKPENQSDCDDEIRKIQQTLGCQVIVNGVIPTIRYYLRLLKDPSEFFPVYAYLLKSDRSQCRSLSPSQNSSSVRMRTYPSWPKKENYHLQLLGRQNYLLARRVRNAIRGSRNRQENPAAACIRQRRSTDCPNAAAPCICPAVRLTFLLDDQDGPCTKNLRIGIDKQRLAGDNRAEP